jgi:hypothetical protein
MTCCSRLDTAEVEKAISEGIVVDFYGDAETCQVSAPDVLPEGKYRFILNDLDEETAADLYIGRITGDHKYQELLDPQEEPGKYYSKPEWLIYAFKNEVEIVSEDERRYTVTLEPGEHAIYVFTTPKGGLWFCTPIMVVESDSG